MWDEIAAHISRSIGAPFTIAATNYVGGGSINRACQVIGDDRQFFVKTNTAAQVGMFEVEAIALEQMHATNTILVPKPICWGTAAGSSYFVAEWLELTRSQDWSAMGHKLAAMHRVTSSKGFGWDRQNVIGATPQVNTWESDWVEFYSKHRLQFQLKLARRNGFSCRISEQELLDAVPKFFETYQPQPAMVHGDLWSGNLSFAIVNGKTEPAIFDPALYYGDREVDIAMTELFGSPPASFYQAYNQSFPLDPGYQKRKTLYNLYHILNHFNLFGAGYGSQAQRMIEQVCRM
ncbi:Fructosamine/Ketosamine-3-kinase [Thalassoporum mexicanum PCC 7367]|uniref:fructosamine kinase family protein n=1 Tax=Thalassoporum mexicanum TaxID=3457544 RepID=UPI00029FF3B8|nr:fructosamine kinase family protein [Pseudanabaena sp. PCC 7367]AFY68348.1 Fructosamine/Ketosamine-3-kinase [Pseudanabaena sp. PCC 7367]